jgi:hypothetical protein
MEHIIGRGDGYYYVKILEETIKFSDFDNIKLLFEYETSKDTIIWNKDEKDLWRSQNKTGENIYLYQLILNNFE